MDVSLSRTQINKNETKVFLQNWPFVLYYFWRTNFSNVHSFSCWIFWKIHYIFAKTKCILYGFPFSMLQWHQTWRKMPIIRCAPFYTYQQCLQCWCSSCGSWVIWPNMRISVITVTSPRSEGLKRLLSLCSYALFKLPKLNKFERNGTNYFGRFRNVL